MISGLFPSCIRHMFLCSLLVALPPGGTFGQSSGDGPVVRKAGEVVPVNGLWGDKIVTEAGHGRTWYNGQWQWQREDWFPGLHVHSSQEDFNTARMVNRWLLRYLENAGALVYPDRCRDEQTNEVVCDIAGTISSPHTSTGTWVPSSPSDAYGSGCVYSLATSELTPTAIAQLRADIPEDGYYGVTIWYPYFSGAVPDAQFVVIDAAGNRHTFLVDQTRDTGQWVWVDRFYFEAGTDVLVMEVNNISTLFPGGRVVLDGVRLGGGMGSEDFGGGVSGVPRWQECAVNWTKYMGAPDSVWQDGFDQFHDIGTRFAYATWQQTDIFMRLHTNGSPQHTGFGSEAYQFAVDSAQLTRAGYVYKKLIQSIHNHYDSSWKNRGVKQNKVVPSRPYPQIMVEVGFHDYLSDAEALMDADFRRVAMRGYYEGAVDYFTNRTGIYSPEPPEKISIGSIDGNFVQAEWTTATMGGVPDHYRVYYSTHPHCWKDYVSVTSGTMSAEVGPLTPAQIYYFQLRATNTGGISFPSETFAAYISPDPTAESILVVNGFDRFDWDIDETENTRNFCIEHAVAIVDAASSLGLAFNIDSASNEAVANGETALGPYAVVDWILGQEDDVHETFNVAEQTVVAEYRNWSGVFVVSGTNVATDLDVNGSATDQLFFQTQLEASFVSRFENPDSLQAATGGLFDGIGLTLDSDLENYNVLGGDVISPVGGGLPTYSYGSTGSTAAIHSANAGSFLFYFAFPFEAIDTAVARHAVMKKILPFAPDKSFVADWTLY